MSGSTAFSGFDEFDVTLNIEGTENLTVEWTGSDWIKYSATPNLTIKSEGVSVKVTIEKEVTGNVTLTGLKINDKEQSRTFSKRLEDAIVKIVNQKDLWGTTEFTLEVQADSDVTVSDFKVTLDDNQTWGIVGVFSDGDTFEIKGIADAVRLIEKIEYKVDKKDVPAILKSEYNDFFKVGDTYARVFQSNK